MQTWKISHSGGRCRGWQHVYNFFHDSHESSSSDDVSDEEDSSNEEVDVERNKIYKEADQEFARFLIEMRLALNEHHDFDYTAVNYLKVFYKKFKAFKSSNL